MAAATDNKSTAMVEKSIMQMIQSDTPNTPLFEVLFENKGVVYGGYLRDIIAGDKPNDIDVVLFEDKLDSFLEATIKLGYTKTIKDDGLIVLTKANCLKVEAFADGKSTDDVTLGASCDPDYSVNLLTTNGKELYSWVDAQGSVTDIISNILARVAVEMAPSGDRVKKMESKGYKIVANEEELYDF